MIKNVPPVLEAISERPWFSPLAFLSSAASAVIILTIVNEIKTIARRTMEIEREKHITGENNNHETD